MSALADKPLPPRAAVKAKPRHIPGGASLGQEQSREVQRLAAAILEVLAGVRTPAQAASVLSVSVPRYYQLEARALQGLLRACAPLPHGRLRSADKELAALRQQCARLERDLARQQTLLRLAQRSIGLAPPPPPVKEAGKKRPRRPLARALRVAAHLQQANPEPAAESPAPEA